MCICSAWRYSSCLRNHIFQDTFKHYIQKHTYMCTKSHTHIDTYSEEVNLTEVNLLILCWISKNFCTIYKQRIIENHTRQKNKSHRILIDIIIKYFFLSISIIWRPNQWLQICVHFFLMLILYIKHFKREWRFKKIFLTLMFIMHKNEKKTGNFLNMLKYLLTLGKPGICK